MIGLALEECRKLGINKVLMTCDKTNIGSAKSIINNGGVLESELRRMVRLSSAIGLHFMRKPVESGRLSIQVAQIADAKKLLAIYAPYVRETAITFEYEVPTIEEFAVRIAHTLERIPRSCSKV